MEIENPTPSPQSSEILYICDRLRDMGYAQSKRIRIYGEEFEVTSNPFPEGNGIAVQAVGKHDKQARVLKLPLPVLQTVRKKIA